MAKKKDVRITFSCSSTLKKSLSDKANQQGIPRSQLIVELLELALGIEDEGVSRGQEVNRFLFDVQKRIADLEKWRREISEWKVSASENSDNLEETIASILNEQLSDIDIQPDEKKKSSIPTPRK
ncbi:MAG: hypothetical protein ACXAE3_04355 [Candidatus Kariarchaeaceae archaeon]|jgi:hypothetical protein